MENLRSASLALQFLIALSCASCGLTTPRQTLPPVKHEQQKIASTFDGSFKSTSGVEVDLKADSTSIQAIMFVSETCAVCRKETRGLVQHRVANGVPKNVAFYSIVVGSTTEDALDWKSDLGVDWNVGTDPGDGLFRRYCPEGQTPCVLLRNPQAGESTKLVGEHSLEEWQAIAGKWSY